MGFLKLDDKTIAIFGLANKKSVAYFCAQSLVEAGARVIHVVQDEARREAAAKLFPDSDIYICDVERQEEIDRVAGEIAQKHPVIHGLVHSIAFANYSEGMKSFHETPRQDFLQAVNISCFSLIAIANAFKGLLAPDASVVTISISTTRMAAEQYGYMAPVKAALDSAVCFLAKSFSAFSRVRFNAVCPGLLKTSASAGIPGYLKPYLFAEQATLRKEALKTSEVGDVVAFLMSERSSGINAQGIVVDAGMCVNYFDGALVERATRMDG
ncbi:MAG: SDR family oxidoreductase [Candidatus Sumerlaeota bacterium]|nr:SDR family oxidoreductase [Candidatus Sumerlaeota bacterium]